MSMRTSRSSSRSSGGAPVGLISIGVVIMLVLLVGGMLFAAASETVKAGSVAVVTRNGADVGQEDAGRVWLTPVIESTEIYEVSVQQLEFTGGERSTADYHDSVITNKSKDGVNANYAAMLSFRIDEAQVRDIYKNRGRSQDNLVRQHVQVITRDAARDIIEQGMIDDIYLGGMGTYSQLVEDELTIRLAAIGVIVEDFNFTAIDPADAYKQAIEQQKEQQQTAQLEAEKVEVARQTAEQKRVAAQGDADAEVIRAQGEADANAILSASLTEEILTLEYYETLQSSQWMMLPSDGGLQPTLPIQTPAAEEPQG